MCVVVCVVCVCDVFVLLVCVCVVFVGSELSFVSLVLVSHPLLRPVRIFAGLGLLGGRPFAKSLFTSSLACCGE